MLKFFNKNCRRFSTLLPVRTGDVPPSSYVLVNTLESAPVTESNGLDIPRSNLAPLTTVRESKTLDLIQEQFRVDEWMSRAWVGIKAVVENG